MGLDGLALLRETVGETAADLQIRLEPQCKLLAGHFPGEPMLSGVAHLSLALEGAERLERHAVALSGVRGFRLRHVVRPGDVVEVHVSRTDRIGELRFELRVGDVLSSSGVLTLAARATHG